MAEFGYFGPLPAGVETTGELDATVSVGYDDFFRPTSFTYAGAAESYAYDKDDLMTSASGFTIARNASTGFPASMGDGTLLVTPSINGYGEVASLAYEVDGFLSTWTDGSDVTTYDYNSQGHLIEVVLPDTTEIEYLHDALGRRVAKVVDSTVTEKYLWAGMNQGLLAVYNSSDQLVVRYKYAGGRLPVSFSYSSATYYPVYDQVGSLRAIYDTSGTKVHEITYDAFGNILSESGTFAGPVPHGYAGGLHDRQTGLVRFGYRDYDPKVGRWTAKDPIGFAGGDVSLYGYVLGNPILGIDSDGLRSDLPTMSPGVITSAASQGLNLIKSAFKQVHYNRNSLNKPIPQNVDEEWGPPLGRSKDVYHRQAGEIHNLKYVSPDGHREAVLSQSGDHVTNPKNIATYNFHGLDNPFGHFLFDILPYIAWGNTPDDESTVLDRLLAPLTIPNPDCPAGPPVHRGLVL